MRRWTASPFTPPPPLAFLLMLAGMVWVHAAPEDQLRKDKAELSPLQGLVGKWKGTGFLRSAEPDNSLLTESSAALWESDLGYD